MTALSSKSKQFLSDTEKEANQVQEKSGRSDTSEVKAEDKFERIILDTFVKQRGHGLSFFNEMRV